MRVSEMTFLRDHWYPVAVAADVTPESGPRAVRLLGDEFVLWASGPDEYALSEPFCPHRSAHLAGGWVDAGRLVCAYHGWQFDGSGHCRHIPQMDPGLPTPPRAELRTYPAQARYGVVWACVGDPVSERPPAWPEAEHADRDGWRLFVEFFEEWHVAAPRIIDNNLDHGHVAFVHRTTFGDPRDARIPAGELELTDLGFRSRIVAEQPGVAKQNGQTADESVRVRRTAEVELLAPLTTRTRLTYHGQQPDYAFFGAATPIDDSRSIYLRLTALAGREHEQPWDTFHAFGTRVKEEDRVILESTVDDFPVDITSEVHLRCDRATLEYRKHLMRLASAPVAVAPSVLRSA